MPRQKPWSSFVALIVTFSGFAAVITPMMLASSDLTFPLALAMLAGIAIGAPVIIIGLRMHPSSVPRDQDSNRFWPTRTEWWGIVALVTFAACYLAPAGLVVLLFYYLPPGDQWRMAIVRSLLIFASACCGWWWITFATTCIPELFRGKLSDETLDASKAKEETSDEPINTLAAVLKHWHLTVVAIAALFVIYGIINFNFAGLNPANAAKRVRGFVRLLNWCGQNPNTTTLVSGSVGLGALVLYAYRVQKAYFRTSSSLSDSRHRDKLHGDLPKDHSVAEQLTLSQLEAGLELICGSPKNDGVLKLIVRRPQPDVREVLTTGELDPAEGLVGDSWKSRGSNRTTDGSSHPDMQLNIMNSRVIALLAQHPDRWPLAGDQLFVDMDLSTDNMPAGTRLAIGSAIILVTAQPHTGCGKFMARFGADALRFVNSDVGKQLHLRGINARIVQSGVIRVGDVVKKRHK